ncbi:hypothetical protein [Sphingomonas sp. DT-204]|uniref:hypothetical protein n=1 Tax=Sphingomonas sp. DT-204 TaxID=3396166 RepID=UPI003F1C881A
MQSRRTWRVVATALLVVTGLIFVAGVIDGYSGAAAGGRQTTSLIVAGGAAFVVVGVALGLMWREVLRRKAAGPGEAAERRRAAGFWSILTGIALVGFAVGFTISLTGSHLHEPLPAWPALGAAVVVAATFAGGTWLIHRRMDEVERADNDWAAAVGAKVLMTVYPIWYLLAKGGWVPEPTHEMLFLGLFAIAAFAYSYRKFR